jgi:hypothetical protein
MVRRPGKESTSAAFQGLKEMLSGASVRALAGIREVGEVVLAKIGGDDQGDAHDVQDQKRDVWVRFTDALTGMSQVGRLFAPAGILWRAAANGDSALVIRARKMGGPGGPVVFPVGGDGATDNVVPDWFPDDAGLFEPTKKLHVEAKGDELDLTGTVVNVNGTDYALIKDTLLTDLSNLLKCVSVVLLSSTSTGPLIGASLAPSAAGDTDPAALATNLLEIPRLVAKLAVVANYKSTKVKFG